MVKWIKNIFSLLAAFMYVTAYMGLAFHFCNTDKEVHVRLLGEDMSCETIHGDHHCHDCPDSHQSCVCHRHDGAEGEYHLHQTCCCFNALFKVTDSQNQSGNDDNLVPDATITLIHSLTAAAESDIAAGNLWAECAGQMPPGGAPPLSLLSVWRL